MSVEKEDLLSLARELSLGDTESHWRCAISRAYYAAYHGCNCWHRQLQVPGSNAGPTGGVHQELINCLQNPAPEVAASERATSKILSIKLNVLRMLRTKADYHLDEQVDAVRAANACAQSNEILLKL